MIEDTENTLYKNKHTSSCFNKTTGIFFLVYPFLSPFCSLIFCINHK